MGWDGQLDEDSPRPFLDQAAPAEGACRAEYQEVREWALELRDGVVPN